MSSRKPPIPSPHRERIAGVRQSLAAQNVDAYLVQDRMDQFWLTGFTGEDGAVLLTRRAVVLLTDGRFTDTADREAPYARKVIRTRRGPESMAREARRLRIARLGFNPDHMTVRQFTENRKLLDGVKLVSTTDVIRKLREVKDETEVATIRRSIDIAQRAFKKIVRWMRPGMTEREVAARLVHEMQSLGAQGPSFPPIIASGPNAAIPHHEPSERKLRRGEPVLIDWGAQVDWYASDLTRMVWMGSIPPQIKAVHKIVRDAQVRAVAAVGPGVRHMDVDKAARDFIREAGYGDQFTHGVGHGLGLHVHDVMTIGRESKETLKPGMVVTIEPGIYLPGVGGVRLEDDVLVTETGREVLSSLPLDPPQ